MGRALWKGSLAFGLVNIPVELHTAVRDSRPRFRLLHGKDLSPVEYQRVCRKEGKPVAWEDLVKGYEYQKGHFVTLTKDDFETAALEKSRTVDIMEFVDVPAIDDRFFETPYYVVPVKGAERAYAVLREALRKTGKAGISRIILREKQHLAALEATEDALTLTMLRFAEELVDTKPLKLPSEAVVRGKELDVAVMLVESLGADWEPDKYKDEYTANLMRIIRAKMKGKKPRLEEPEEPVRQAEIIDLMSRLKKSLEVSKAGSKGSKSRPARKTAAKSTRGTVKRRKGTSRAA